ncbi:hypothetical protein NPIL_499201, partial [Nephila pilipes]
MLDQEEKVQGELSGSTICLGHGGSAETQMTLRPDKGQMNRLQEVV